ncbi:MAG: response regulator [Prevotella sp.]|nr:response regulator [Prevotella sp.]
MKRLILLLYLLTALALLTARASDDGTRYRSINMDDGLPSNAVRNIVQDRYGFIWLGTDNGLCRYDGVRVQTYRMAELGLNQYVSALLATDQGLYVGTENGVFCLDFSSQAFSRLPIDLHTTVSHLATDKEDNLWIATMGQGAWCYTLKTGQTRHYGFKDSGGNVAQVLADQTNQIWAMVNSDGDAVLRLNRLRDKFEPLRLDYPTPYNGLRLLQTHDGRMWIGTWEQGLLLMHSDGRLEQMLSPEQAKVGQHIHTLFQPTGTPTGSSAVRDGCIYIGCDDGVVCFDPLTRQWNRLLDDRFVYAIMGDDEGGMWIGTFYGGTRYLSPVGRRFEGLPMLQGSVVSHFCEDGQQRVWVASDDGGLMCYLPREQRFSDYAHSDELGKLNVHALCTDGDDLWIGTYTDGVWAISLTTGRLRHYEHSSDPHSLDDNSSYAISKDREGRLWVATMQGLNLYDREHDNFRRIGTTGAMTIDIDQDHKGRLWLATQGAGIWHYDQQKGQFRQYQYFEKEGRPILNNQVNCTIIDEGGTLWTGTLGGLFRYDAEADSFRYVRMDLPTENVTSIVEDHDALWIGTDRGIVRFVPGQGVQRFTRHDGLVCEQVQPNAGLKTTDGRIYFGTTSGVNTFYPYQIKTNSVVPPVYITSVEILNHEETTDQGLPLDLSLTRELVLSYGDRMLSLSYASLSFCSPEKNQYAYRLEGFDKDWNYVGNQHKATYTNLPAGTYTFRVKATNNDGEWSANEATLRIVVRPPFWWSWWAKLCYLLLVVALIWWLVHQQLKREQQRHQRELQQLNEAKEKEVREARLNFFTMIAHEIRTPVSLIIGPLEKLKKEAQLGDGLDIIDRNAHRLLELVNQLLDFRKVEQQSLVMHLAPQNIYDLLQAVAERFAPTFAQGGKQFVADYPDRNFTAIVDREALTKVVSNLLTNANKYTKDQVKLSCRVEPDGDHFVIEVADNGIGIREEDRQRIFEPFFQAMDNKPGTGIGLNIVKNIVDQHHGQVSVASTVGQGSVFTVVLPVVPESPSAPEAPASAPEAQEAPLTPEVPEVLEAPTGASALLIVDDNEDMVTFLAKNFADRYQVLTATNGIEALEKLQHHDVSIIVSDWMMPQMDGAELCRRVRANAATSHIAFIMLTAKTDNDSKVQGMDVGADVYIEKPFSVQYLEGSIKNLLDMRHRLQQRFSSQPFQPLDQIASNPTDNEFLKKMNQIIEDNFSNPDLSVNFLAAQLAISRSGLFAKLKTLADMTPNEMIQTVRLKRAAALLAEGQYHVNEVCYMVGFSSPSYFTKCFLKQFGIRPSEIKPG